MKKALAVLMSLIMVLSFLQTLGVAAYAAEINEKQNFFEEMLASIPETTIDELPSTKSLRLGDANDDAKVSVVDAKMILQNMANIISFNSTQLMLCDVNEDSKISILDAKWILQSVAGMRELATIEVDRAVGSCAAVDVFSINDLKITDDNEIIAKVSAPENCALVVRFMKEDIFFSEDNNKEYIDGGYLYASQLVTENSNDTEYSCTANGELPSNYVAQAVLLNSEGEELCTVCSNIDNTERHEKFEALSVDDFSSEGDRVLNFDESKVDNFGVLAEDVLMLTAQSITYDYEADKYVILGPSRNISKGDKIYISDAVNTYLFRAKSVNVVEDSYIVTPADVDDSKYNYQLSDFYSFIKVDSEGVVSPEEIESENSNLKFEGADASGSIEIKLPLEIDLDNLECEGSLGVKIGYKIDVEYDIVLFGKDYFKCDFTTENEMNFVFNAFVKVENGDDSNKNFLDNNFKLNLGKFGVPLGVPALDAYVKLEAVFEWKLEGGIELEGKLLNTSGFKFNTKDGVQKIDKKESTWTFGPKGHVEIKAGPKVEAGVEFLSGVVKACVEAFLGVKAEADFSLIPEQGGTYIHACYACLEGNVKFVYTIDLKLNYNIFDTIKGTPIDLQLVNGERKLFDFYVSLLNDQNSMFAGHIHSGRGECPNKSYKTKILTANSDLRYIENVDVKIYEKDTDNLKLEARSNDIKYLPSGSYTAKANIDGVECIKNFYVCESEQEIIVCPIETSCLVKGSVFDASTRESIKGATIDVYKDTTNIISVNSDDNGDFEISVDSGFYTLVAKAEDHVSTFYYFTANFGETNYLDPIYLADKNSSVMGGIYGEIKDSKTGNPVENAKISVTKGWGDIDSQNTKVFEITTDADGKYDIRRTTLFGIDFGLNAGNYTINVEKRGYISTSFNVTVIGGSDKKFDSTLAPVGSENEYSISLTWGEFPHDIDSHLNAICENRREHVYYASQVGYYAELDIDDVSSYGPETVTIYDINAYSGNVMYSVHDYSNRYASTSNELSLSGATVRVYKGDRLLKTFYVPTENEGTVWNVFYFDENKNIVPVNSFEYIEEPNNVCGYPGLGDYVDPDLMYSNGYNEGYNDAYNGLDTNYRSDDVDYISGYDSGYYSGKCDITSDGYNAGYDDACNDLDNNPNSENCFFIEGYNEGYSNGVSYCQEEGYNNGYNDGYNGREKDLIDNSYYDQSYNEGYETGYNVKYDEGYETGYNDGLFGIEKADVIGNSAYDTGYDYGYDMGYSQYISDAA